MGITDGSFLWVRTCDELGMEKPRCVSPRGQQKGKTHHEDQELRVKKSKTTGKTKTRNSESWECTELMLEAR